MKFICNECYHTTMDRKAVKTEYIEECDVCGNIEEGDYYNDSFCRWVSVRVKYLESILKKF